MNSHRWLAKVLLAAALIASASAWAGNEIQVKTRAKNLRDNLSETPPPPPGSPPPAAVPAPPPPPKLTPAQTAIARIQSEISAIVTKGEATDELKQRLSQAILGSALTGGKPGDASVQTFAGDLADAIAGKDVAAQARSQLALYLNNACNSTSLSVEQLNKTITDFQSLLRLAGVPRRDAGDLGDALKSLAEEVRKPSGK